MEISEKSLFIKINISQLKSSLNANIVYLVEPVPRIYNWLKLRNRNATTIQTCLSTQTKPQVIATLIHKMPSSSTN